MTVDELVARGLLERVEADSKAAQELIATASTHLLSARAIAESDTAGAYQLGYDGARKAIAAHMTANGLRVVKKKPGGHETTGRYAIAAINDDAEAIKMFERMRRRRNRSEYGVAHFEVTEVVEALDIVERIIGAVARSLP